MEQDANYAIVSLEGQIFLRVDILRACGKGSIARGILFIYSDKIIKLSSIFIKLSREASILILFASLKNFRKRVRNSTRKSRRWGKMLTTL